MTAAKSAMVEILMVEDNAADARLTLEAFKDAKVLNNINITPDGEEAMAFLRREGKYTNAPRPDLILLDLNLPKKDGREVLEEIKKDPELKRIPVVVLTTSADEQDILKVYNLCANAYVKKPVDLDQFIKIVETIENFWFSVVKLPPKQKNPELAFSRER
ncbi:MAG: response regulator [Deltaproteobacteria bacterium]|nr:response regulator [Deltaproteobacteria bacterium]